MNTYQVNDDGNIFEIQAENLDQAINLAEEELRDAYQDGLISTLIFEYTVTGPDGEESRVITIDPEEPSCDKEEHAWERPIEIVGGCDQNPGVYGHGGGVVITEVCAHCGAIRETDTWGTAPWGEQGYTVITYKDPTDETRQWAERQGKEVLDADDVDELVDTTDEQDMPTLLAALYHWDTDPSEAGEYVGADLPLFLTDEAEEAVKDAMVEHLTDAQVDAIENAWTIQRAIDALNELDQD